MTTSDLQSRLDVVVVGHTDGAGRAVVWQGAGVKADAPAVRQAAVLPARAKFTGEPGWLLRKLPSNRWLLLAGGTSHDDLRDSFGRHGIFHGVGFVASAADMGVALCAPDATALCLELSRLAVERRLAPSSHARAAEASARKNGVIKTKLIPSRETETALPDASWRSVQDALRRLGMRPLTAPTLSSAVPSITWNQPVIEAKRQDGAIALDGAAESARRIITAWS